MYMKNLFKREEKKQQHNGEERPLSIIHGNRQRLPTVKRHKEKGKREQTQCKRSGQLGTCNKTKNERKCTTQIAVTISVPQALPEV